MLLIILLNNTIFKRVYGAILTYETIILLTNRMALGYFVYSMLINHYFYVILTVYPLQ